MHEYGITEEIVKIVLEKIDHDQKVKVKVVNISMGTLTGFIPDSIEFYFPYVSKGTPLEEARLKFNIKKTRLLCKKCKKEFESEDIVFLCPYCDNDDIKVMSGREFLIESIEVEDEKD